MGPQFFVDGGFVCTYKGITRLLGRGRVRGSPPHTRGKVTAATGTAYRRGITPAHAGKSHRHLSRLAFHRDHPRTRGEKRRYCPGFASSQGSPPHTRGKVSDVAVQEGDQGITPAHAGKRNLSGHRKVLSKDHPRACGEKGLRISSAAWL